MVQLPEEFKYQYLMRCIEIRQVMLASNKSDVKYDKELARKLQSIIRSNVSDEDLLAAAAKASVTEKERNLVQGKHHKKALRVYEVSGRSNRSGQTEMGNQDGNSGSGKVDKLLSAVDTLTKKVN